MRRKNKAGATKHESKGQPPEPPETRHAEQYRSVAMSIQDPDEHPEEAPDANSEVNLLRAEVASLQQRLQLVEAANQVKGVTKCGYLYKYRPFGAGFFVAPWSLRFFSLAGSTLLYYKTAEQAPLHYRARFDLSAGVTVEIEGLKRERYWTLSLVDGSGGSLLRLSTEVEHEARLWVTAFRAAGCPVLASPDWHAAPEPASDDPPPEGPAAAASAKMRFHKSTPAKRPRVGEAEAGQQWPEPLQKAMAAAAAEAARRRAQFEWTLRACAPVHKSRPSLLSTDRETYQYHFGIVNLVLVVLLATNSQLMIANFLKYGFLMKNLLSPDAIPPSMSTDAALAVTWLAGSPLFVLGAFIVDKLAASRALPSEYVVGLLHVMNIVACLGSACWVIHGYNMGALPSVAVLLVAVTACLKLWSFAHATYDLRTLSRSEESRSMNQYATTTFKQHVLHYPSSATLQHLAYFMVAPTLCYQLTYPRTARIRKRWLLVRCLRLALCCLVQVVLVQQYIYPGICNSVQPLERLEVVALVHRILKISLPCLYFWLLLFYGYFHLALNILAEVLQFGDREFYRDWWNACNVEQYWKLWNLPVHMWLVRHLYVPARKLLGSKAGAMLVVFLFSAALHELVIALPLHVSGQYWAFLVFIAQVPLIVLTKSLNKLFHSQSIGNLCFWVSFCIFGQPTLALLYYHQYSKLHPDLTCSPGTP